MSLLLLTGTLASALDLTKSLTQYAHRVWDQQEGLLQPTVYSILQTHDGFLWLGTQDSLIRFDGVRFREFEVVGKPVLHRALVRSLLEDPHGNLWVGTVGSGLIEISHDLKLTRFTRQNGFPGANATCLANGSGDDLWICASEGLLRRHAGRFQLLNASNGIPAGDVRATCATPDGTRWVGTGTGLAFSRGQQFQVFNHALLPAGRGINALACETAGDVWAGTDYGLLHIRGSKVHLLTSREGLPDNTVFALKPAKDNTLWIGTAGGLARLYNNVLSSYRERDGLSHNQVLALAEDREGTLWAGTKNGLDQFTDGVVTRFTVDEGLSSDAAGPLLEDTAGRLWIGTLGGGLDVYENGRFRNLSTRDRLLDNTILSLAVDQTGAIWAGTPKGVNCIRDHKVIAAYSERNGLSSRFIRSLLVDARGTLWVATDRGLDRWNGHRFVASHLLEKTDEPDIVALFAGIQTRLFVSTAEDGLYVLRDDKLAHPPTEVSRPGDCLFLDPDMHSAWVGTLGSGLLRWKGGTLRHVRVKDGLYDGRILSILRDDQRNFWLASSKGIFRVSEQELDDVADGKREFVNSIPFTPGQLRFECQSNVQPAAVRTHDGRMWFSTTRGVLMVDPRHLTADLTPPLVQIDGADINGEPVRFGRFASELRLTPEQRNLAIHYAGLSFLTPEKVAFRYMLEGFDRGWMDAGTRREAFFTNLPPGHFTFRVMASNADGIWSRQAASLRFYVAPRFYQRWWFWPAVCLGAVLVAVAAYRVRIRQLERAFQLVTAERTRIARDLHDTLLQGLTGVTMQLQALWNRLPASREKLILGEIIADASRASHEARRSLWDLRSGSGNLPEFSQRLERTVRQATEGSRLALDLQIERVSLRGQPELEFQLLRITAEAVANVRAHAHATRLSVRLLSDPDELQLTIADDGIGFRPELQRPLAHYGLQGMEERAAEIGARFTLSSSPGQGTTVAVALPLHGSHRRPQSNPASAPVHHKG